MTEAMAGTNLREPLARISADLDATGVPWALTGGLAVAAHTGGGTSDDIDVAVGVADDATAEAVVRQLQERGYSAVTTVEHEFTKRLVSVSMDVLGDTDGAPPVQLIFASTGIEPEIAEAAEPREVLGLRVPVASKGHLIASKVLSHELGRPQDADDAAALMRAASETDLQDAEDAFVLIQDRGFDRGRDLMADYELFLSREPEAGG